MPAFGFSAFLKLLSLSPRRQRSELRARLRPSDGAGYDFHRSFRRLAGRFLSGGEPLYVLMDETAGFRNAAEGRSARAGLKYLQEWRADFSGPVLTFQPRTWEDPDGAFTVKFTPDFGLEIDGERVAVHVWNTMRPDLDARMTYAALALFADLYEDEVGGAPDLAVLSIPDGRLYRLSDVPDQSVLASRIAGFIADLIEEIEDEGSSPPPQGVPDRSIHRP